jgi:flagellar protein FlaF
MKLIIHVFVKGRFMSALAQNAYTRMQADGLTGRALEAAVLDKCARELHTLVKRGSANVDAIHKALDRNREMWSIYVASIADEASPLPIEIKRNIADLALYVEALMRKAIVEQDVKALEPIIFINRHLAAGLRGHAGAELPPLQ